MSFDCRVFVRWCALLLSVCVSSSCGGDVLVPRDVEVLGNALEHGCAELPADATGDFLAFLSSIEPFDASRPQPYGSERCTGFIFEFDNSEGEALNGAWVVASGQSIVGSDAIGEAECSERALEADLWGFMKKEWQKLASARSTGSIGPGQSEGTRLCELHAQIDHPGAFQRLRVVARVTHRELTYPMHAILW